MTNTALLLVSLGIILIGAEVFTNGVEWLGERLGLSEGAVGSILAAVGTALPETVIPIIALIFGVGDEAENIGVGAILGAPLMLSTIAMCITGLAVFGFARHRASGIKVTADYTTMSRDLGFFLIVFAAALLTGFIPLRRWQLIIAAFMIFSYLWYVWETLREEKSESEHELKPCYFAPRYEVPPLVLILMQLAFALALIIGGAQLFVDGVEHVARVYGIPAFVLALIIAPIATELPEKFNSVLWISRGKDTLALGNITGAMVFQSSLIPALGIILTDWRLSLGAILTGLTTLASSGIIYIYLRRKKHISGFLLVFVGVFYLFFIYMVLKGYIR